MLEHILEKGDPNNLKGRVFAYSEYLKIPEDKKIVSDKLVSNSFVGLYSTFDPVDFAKKVDLPVELVKLRREFRKEISKILIHEDLSEPEKLIEIHSPGTDVKELYEETIYLGSLSGFRRCLDAADSAIGLYFQFFNEQIEISRGIRFDNITYQDISCEDIQGHLLNYAGRIRVAYDQKDRIAVRGLKNNLINFGKGSVVLEDINELSHLLGDPKNDGLISDLILKITAVKQERFDGLKELQEKINNERKQ